MKILLAHNYYQQPGGEDGCFAAETAMLQAFGHEVIQYRAHNDAIKDMTRMDVASRAIWNRSSYREIRQLLQTHRPQIAHFHNTFPLISPAAYYAARAENVAVVQTLHNFRMSCPQGLFSREGRICEDCLGKRIAWPGIVHKCYRGSRAATTAVATMLAVHRALGTWRKTVDRYIALTEASRLKFIKGGLPESKFAVKPNFVYPDPGQGSGAGGYAAFVGRLSPEKGIETLLAAWKLLSPGLPLKIAGDGPVAATVAEAATRDHRIEWLGRKTPEEVYELVGEATFLVMPSLCYETFGRVIIEAFAKGTPVIAARISAMAELIDHGRTGFHFDPGDAADLASKVRLLLSDPAKLQQMRCAARQEYEQKYTAESNHRMLMDIYEQALHQGSGVRSQESGVRSQGSGIRGQKHGYGLTPDPCPLTPVPWPVKVNVIGVGISVTNYEQATSAVLQAAKRRLPGVVSCHAVHAVVTASNDHSLLTQVNSFEVVTPDGQPVRWAMNLLHGTRLGDRVYGPELMLRLCRAAADSGVPIYLYGGTPEVLDKLCNNLVQVCPGLRITGMEAPPFRELGPDEGQAVVERINASGAGLVFIGLGCPKQDRFAYEYRPRIRSVLVCVGAAFDFHAGMKKMAPGWMQRRGLEWFYRLIQEPRRLWRRYLVTNSVFLAKVAASLIRPRLKEESA